LATRTNDLTGELKTPLHEFFGETDGVTAIIASDG
jgi:hypothetical protein